MKPSSLPSPLSFSQFISLSFFSLFFIPSFPLLSLFIYHTNGIPPTPRSTVARPFQISQRPNPRTFHLQNPVSRVQFHG